MITLPVAQSVNRFAGDLKIGGSKPDWDTLSLNPILAGVRPLSGRNARC